MGRPRSFDEQQVVASAAELFTARGYEATSVDDLLRATGLHRGSLYQAFGSKQGVFVAALRRLVTEELRAHSSDPAPPVAGNSLDLVLIAALELAPVDEEVRGLVERACALLQPPHLGEPTDDTATALGRRLLARAHLSHLTPTRS